MSRRRSLAVIGLGLVLPSCKPNSDRLKIGSTRSARNTVIAEIYAAALERANVRVERFVEFDDSQSLMAALRAEKVDLFPGYVGPQYDGTSLVDSEKTWYENHLGVTWLERSRATEGQCLVTSAVSAERFWLVTLARCAKIASSLRLAATRDFVARREGLDKLRSVYGRFQFKSVTVCDDGDQYALLNRDASDVANGFSTAPEIAEDQLGVLADPKSCFPANSVAPVVRIRYIRARPHLARILDRVSLSLNQYALQKLNMQCALGTFSPKFVADEFVMATERRRVAHKRAAAP